MFDKICSEACVRNRDPLLQQLRGILTQPGLVLEIGSCTGQHAAYFSANLPHLRWQPSDVPQYLDTCRQWIEDEGGPNALDPLPLDVRDAEWPVTEVDAIFSANTLHIMSWPEVEQMFAGIDRVLKPTGTVIIYGAMKYNGEYTSASNQRFDAMLRQRDPKSGIRDFEALDELARGIGLRIQQDIDMPSNNQLLVWRRGTCS